MSARMPKKYSRGFTLIEVIIVMVLFTVIIALAAQTFKNVTTLSVKHSKSEESNIEGIIGLEVLRHDLEQMGLQKFQNRPCHVIP